MSVLGSATQRIKKCNTEVEMALREDLEDTVQEDVCWECMLCPRVG